MTKKDILRTVLEVPFQDIKNQLHMIFYVKVILELFIF